VALTSHTGALIQQYRYTVWGEPQVFNAGNQSRPLSEARSPFLFTAREYDLETGLYHYRARAYSPQLGRFLQFDPIDFGGGAPNVVEYVYNNSTNKTDPFGLMADIRPLLCRNILTNCTNDCEIECPAIDGRTNPEYQACLAWCEKDFNECMAGKGRRRKPGEGLPPDWRDSLPEEWRKQIPHPPKTP
jgi:RHS repeat-associated protein